MNINDRTYSRILYIIVWIPLILIPVAYLLPPLKGSNCPLPPPVPAAPHDHPRPHGPYPVLLDMIIALLIIGSNLSIDFYSRYMLTCARREDMPSSNAKECGNSCSISRPSLTRTSS